MAVEGYFDESGTDDANRWLCYAGYLFEKEAAICLNEKWQQMLFDFNDLPYFHMSDVNGHRGVFKEKLSKGQCDELARAAIELVKKYASQGIAISLEKSVYDLLPPNGGLWSGPYPFIVSQVLYGGRNWMNSKKKVGDISYFFEAGAEGMGDSINSLRAIHQDQKAGHVDMRLASYNFVEKTHNGAIQCADILAWHWLRHNRNIDAKKPMRPDFKSLLGVPIDAHHYDAKTIGEFNEVMKNLGS